MYRLESNPIPGVWMLQTHAKVGRSTMKYDDITRHTLREHLEYDMGYKEAISEHKIESKYHL